MLEQLVDFSWTRVCHHCLSATTAWKKEKKIEATLDVRTQTEMRSEKGEEIGCQTAALTTPINVNKKVPVMLKQSRAKRPLLRNTIHAYLAGGYTTHLSGNTVGCFQFHRKFNVFGLIALGKGNKITHIALRVMYYMRLKYLLPCLHIRFRISRTTKASAKSWNKNHNIQQDQSCRSTHLLIGTDLFLQE